MVVAMLGHKLHHVGYATRELAKSRRLYEDMGFAAVTDVIDDPIQKVRVVFFATGSDVLVGSRRAGRRVSPVSNFLTKHGPGLHHLCYEVDDIEAACALPREQGGSDVSARVPAVAFAGRRIAFVFRREGLIELLERAR